MPPKVKFTKEEIVQAALEVARVKGAAEVTTRDIAAQLGVSTRPIFTWFRSMDEVRAEIRRAAEEDIRRDAQRAYVSTCLNVYHSLISAGPGYERDAEQARELLRREAPSFPLLGKKRALMARFAVLAPGLYQPVYGVYRRFLQKNVYS